VGFFRDFDKAFIQTGQRGPHAVGYWTRPASVQEGHLQFEEDLDSPMVLNLF